MQTVLKYILFSYQKMHSLLGLERYVVLLQKVFPKSFGQHILIACFPKSGSSFISQNLATILKYKFVYLSSQQNVKNVLVKDEQNIIHSNLNKLMFINTVTQNHIAATDSNIFAINKYNVKVIVLVRNIFDICMSALDHIENDEYKKSTIVIPESFSELGKEEQLDFIIDMIIPWYFKFYVSWWKVERERKQEILWMTYEDMVKDNGIFFQKIFNFCGCSVEKNVIEAKIDINNQPPTRFNKGIVGRGTALSDAHKKRIAGFAKYYPDVDFSKIGLSSK